MITTLTRRTALAAAAAFAASAAAPSLAAKAMPKVPTDWDAEGFFNELLEKGSGFSAPGPAGRKQAVLVIDTQCKWCMRLIEELMPIFRQVDVRMFPVAVLSPHSEVQGGLILEAADPFARLLEQHDHFWDKDFKGIRYDPAKVSLATRSRVWTNTKITRRTATRNVPFGCFRNSRGEYRPFYSKMSKWELADLFEIDIEKDVRAMASGKPAAAPAAAAPAAQPAAAAPARRRRSEGLECKRDSAGC